MKTVTTVLDRNYNNACIIYLYQTNIEINKDDKIRGNCIKNVFSIPSVWSFIRNRYASDDTVMPCI